MSAVRGRVRGGRVELESELPEGADVVVLASEREESFELADAEVAELEARVKGIDRGDFTSATEAIQKLRSSQ